MRTMSKVGMLFGAAWLGAIAGAPAAAQSSLFSRVSVSGTDSGNCIASPCRTFQYAFFQTAANGRIVCDTGGNFGAVTISRSVTIDCSGTNAIAGVSAAIDTITIDDSATASPGTVSVTIIGLRLDGFGVGRHGVRFQSGFSLTLDNVQIANFRVPSGAFPSGIHFVPDRAARLHVANSLIVNSGQEGGAGIFIQPRQAGYAAVVLENVQLVGNRDGVLVDTDAMTTATSTTNVVINRSVISGNARHGVNVDAGPIPPGAGVTITNSTINGNALTGIFATGPRAQVRVENSTIAGNSTGIAPANGAIIATYGNNSLIGNGVNGAFNGFPSEN